MSEDKEQDFINWKPRHAPLKRKHWSLMEVGTLRVAVYYFGFIGVATLVAWVL